MNTSHNDAIIKMCASHLLSNQCFEFRLNQWFVICCFSSEPEQQQLIFKFSGCFICHFLKTIYCKRRNSTFFICSRRQRTSSFLQREHLQKPQKLCYVETRSCVFHQLIFHVASIFTVIARSVWTLKPYIKGIESALASFLVFTPSLHSLLFIALFLLLWVLPNNCKHKIFYWCSQLNGKTCI